MWGLFLAAPVSADVNSIITFPGGPNGAVQVNKKGNFYGESPFTYSTSTHKLTVPQIGVSTVTLNGITYYFPGSVPAGGTFWRNDGAGGITAATPSTFIISTGIALGVLDGSVYVSTPATSDLSFNSAQFIVTLQGSTTASIKVDPSSVTVMGPLSASNPITLTGSTFGINNASATLQGNTFNAASKLVQLDSLTRYPAIDGSLITNLTGSNISNIDISNDTNLQVSTPITLTGDVVGIDLSGIAQLASTQTYTGKPTFTHVVTISTTIAGVTRIQWSDGTIQVSSPSATAGGFPIYPSTGMPTFPYGLVTTTITASTITLAASTGYGANLIYGPNNSVYGGPGVGNQTGQYQVGFGVGSLGANAGSGNIGVGFYAGAGNGGTNNIALGEQTLGSGSTQYSNNNIAIGQNAIANPNAATSNNVAIGQGALKHIASYGESTAIGWNALTAATSGFENIGIGVDALTQTTTGWRNVAVGDQALYFNRGGISNTAFGDQAGGDFANALHTPNPGVGFNTFLGAQTGVTSSNTLITDAFSVGYNTRVGCSDCGLLGSTAVDFKVGIGSDTPTYNLSVTGPEGIYASSITLKNLVSTNLAVDSAGHIIAGTVGGGGASGLVNTASQNQVPRYSVAGTSNALSGASNLTNDGTTVTIGTTTVSSMSVTGLLTTSGQIRNEGGSAGIYANAGIVAETGSFFQARNSFDDSTANFYNPGATGKIQFRIDAANGVGIQQAPIDGTNLVVSTVVFSSATFTTQIRLPSISTGSVLALNSSGVIVSTIIPTSSGGGSGSSALEVLAGVSRTSPTVTVGFPSTQFSGAVTGSSMTVTLLSSSVTLQGNAYSIANIAADTGTIKTLDATRITFSSISATSPITYNSATGAIGATSISLSSQVAGTLPTGNMVSTVAFTTSSQTFSAQQLFNSPAQSTVTYGLAVGSLTVVGTGNLSITENSLTGQIVLSTAGAGITAGHCLMAGSSMTIVDAGAACGTGSGGSSSGNLTNVAPQYSVPYYSATGSSNTLSGSGNFQWNGTSVTVKSSTTFSSVFSQNSPLGFVDIFSQSNVGAPLLTIGSGNNSNQFVVADETPVNIRSNGADIGALQIGGTPSGDNVGDPYSLTERVNTGAGSQGVRIWDTGENMDIGTASVGVGGNKGTINFQIGTNSLGNGVNVEMAISSFGVTVSTSLTVTSSVTLTSVGGAGLALCGDSTHGLGYTATTGQFTCQSITGSGGGGSSTLAVGTGTASAFSFIPSSPTAGINFDSATHGVSLQGSATAFVTLNTSSVTLQGNSVSLSALASSMTTVTASTGTLYTLANGKINLSSITAVSPLVWNSATGAMSTLLTFSSMTVTSGTIHNGQVTISSYTVITATNSTPALSVIANGTYGTTAASSGGLFVNCTGGGVGSGNCANFYTGAGAQLALNPILTLNSDSAAWNEPALYIQRANNTQNNSDILIDATGTPVVTWRETSQSNPSAKKWQAGPHNGVFRFENRLNDDSAFGPYMQVSSATFWNDIYIGPTYGNQSNAAQLGVQTSTGNTYGLTVTTTTGNIAPYLMTLTTTGIVNLPQLTASLPVQTDSGKNLVSAAVDVSGSQATGVLAAGRFPALTGDVTTVSGALATTAASRQSNITTLAASSITITGGLTVSSNVFISTNAVLGAATYYANGVILGASMNANELTGTLQAGQFPALTGAVTTSAGALATTLASNQSAAVTWTSSQTFANVKASSDVFMSTGAAVGFDEFQGGTYLTISTITWENSNKQTVTLTANTTFNFIAPNNSASLILRVATGAGSFTGSWPASVKWSAGSAPTITATASKVDIIACYYSKQATTYYCSATQNF